MIRAAILLALATPAQAQQCAPMAEALAALASRYSETPRAQGLASDGRLVVITASEAGGWSMLIITPDGTACMVAAGEAFGIVEAPAPGSDS